LCEGEKKYAPFFFLQKRKSAQEMQNISWHHSTLGLRGEQKENLMFCLIIHYGLKTEIFLLIK